MDVTNQFGLIAGDWNEAIATIKTYISSANPKAQKTLHPELGCIIGSIIEEWGRFEELPKELQGQVRKAKQTFLNTEDKFMDRLKHFFNEMKIRTSSLGTTEKEGVVSLIALYQPQVYDSCHKRDVESVLHLLNQLTLDLNRLAMQSKEPSRPMGTLVVKTRHDLTELDSFGNKGNKSRKNRQ